MRVHGLFFFLNWIFPPCNNSFYPTVFHFSRKMEAFFPILEARGVFFGVFKIKLKNCVLVLRKDRFFGRVKLRLRGDMIGGGVRWPWRAGRFIYCVRRKSGFFSRGLIWNFACRLRQGSEEVSVEREMGFFDTKRLKSPFLFSWEYIAMLIFR